MFKKLILNILVLTLTVSAYPFGYAAADESAVNINFGEIVKDTERKMYGANFEWGGEEDIYLKGSELEINPEFVECFLNHAPFNRMAGTSANNFYWKKAVGNIYNRSEQTMWGTTKVMRFGPVEWINATKSADSNAGYIYTVNLNDTDNNIADLVEFMTGDGTVNYNGGLNWASKRKQYGIDEPVTDIIWELGNEIDLYGTSVSEYTERAKSAISAIKSVDKNAKIAAHAHTYATNKVSGWDNWHKTVLTELGNDISAITMHYYYPVNGSFKAGEEALSTVISDIKEITNRDDIEIIFSENASATKSHNSPDDILYRYPHTIKGVLATAEFYMRMMKYPEVTASNYHSIRSASWGLCYVEDQKVKPTAVYKMQKLFMDKMCGETFSVEIDSNENIYAGAVKTDKGINVAVINKSENSSIPIKLNLPPDYVMESEDIIYAEKPDADLHIGYNEIYDIHKENKTDADELILKPLSVSFFEFVEDSGVEEFSQKFMTSELGSYDRCITGADIENRPQEIATSHIVGDASGERYKASAADNMYFWNKDENGSYYRQKAGIDGFYGYFNRLSTDSQLTVATAKYLSVLNTGSDGVLQMAASGDSGYKQYTSFGKYDINLGGYSEITAKIGIGVNSPGSVKLELVQNKEEGSDKVGGSIELLSINKNNELYLKGSDTPLLTLVPMSYSNVSLKKEFATLKIGLFNNGEKLIMSLKVFGSDGKLTRYIPDYELQKEYSINYNLTKNRGGVRFVVNPSGWDLSKVFLLDEFAFSKIPAKVLITENTKNEDVTVIKAEYDGNRLISLKVFPLNAGDLEYYKDVADSEGSRYFAFNSFDELKSVKIQVSEVTDGKIIVVE